MKPTPFMASKPLFLPKPWVQAMPRRGLSRSLRPSSLVLWVSQRRYLRALNRFAKLSDTASVWGGVPSRVTR